MLLTIECAQRDRDSDVRKNGHLAHISIHRPSALASGRRSVKLENKSPEHNASIIYEKTMTYRHIIFLSAGEHPAKNALFEAQFLDMAKHFAVRGLKTTTACIVPWIADLRLTARKGVSTNPNPPDITVKSFLSLTNKYSYLLEKPLSGRAADHLLASLPSEFPHGALIHARSYFAASVALQMKARLRNVRVSFDMRSVLSNELPFMFPLCGAMMYGLAKEFEHELLHGSDIAFLPSRLGVDALCLDHGVRNLHYLPIAGLSPRHRTSREHGSRVVYAGSFGQWNSLAIVESVFAYFEMCGFTREAATDDSRAIGHCSQQRRVPHASMGQFYDGASYAVIPGFIPCYGHLNFFQRYKMSNNYFSTKAAEALSAGIPLLVNEELRDLVSYVRRNDCGIVFRMENGKPVFEADPLDSTVMAAVRSGANRSSSEFYRERVWDSVEMLWRQRGLL